MLKRIHVNQAAIRRNMARTSDLRPVITVTDGQVEQEGNDVEILDQAGNVVGRFIYQPKADPESGVRVWFETDLAVVVRTRPAA